jgi:glycosyltransferase involved in cell wall biosynthesis
LSDRGELAADLEAEGVEVLSGRRQSDDNTSSQRHPTRIASAVINLFSFLRRWQPQIAHFYLPGPYVIGAPLAIANRTPIKIMSRRSLSVYQQNWPIVAGVERVLHKKMDALVGNSRAVVAQLVDEGAPESRVRLIYNGLEVSKLLPCRSDARRELGLDEETLVGVTIANLIHYKGHKDLITGLGHFARQQSSPWRALLAGRDDGLQPKLEQLAQNEGIADKMQFLGQRSDVPRLLAAADFGLLTSHEEGFSNVILESMRAGLPMIVTDVGGNPEAVLNERTGLVVPPHNPRAIGEAILRLSRDPDLRRRLGAAAQKRVLEEFYLERCVQAHRDMYEELLAGAQPRNVCVETSEPKVILHVISGLGLGGAERMLKRVVLSEDKSNVRRHVVISLTDEGFFGRKLCEAGIGLHCLRLNHFSRLLPALFRLPALMRRIRPDVVMTCLFHADFVGTLAAVASGVGVRRVVWNLRCSDAELNFKDRCLVALLAWLSPLPHGIAANSVAGRRAHEALGYRPRNWFYLHNGLDPDKWRPSAVERKRVRSKLGLEQSTPLIGMVARVDPQKDYATLLSAAKLVVARHPLARFVLIGRDTERLPASDWLMLLGERDDIEQLMRALDVFVLSSCYGEGSSNVVAEAMASEVPCVVTDVGDSAVLVGDSGLVVPPCNPEALAAAINALLAESPQTRAGRGRRARETVRQNYGLQSAIQQYQRVWQSVRSSKTSASQSSAFVGKRGIS